MCLLFCCWSLSTEMKATPFVSCCVAVFGFSRRSLTHTNCQMEKNTHFTATKSRTKATTLFTALLCFVLCGVVGHNNNNNNNNNNRQADRRKPSQLLWCITTNKEHHCVKQTNKHRKHRQPNSVQVKQGGGGRTSNATKTKI